MMNNRRTHIRLGRCTWLLATSLLWGACDNGNGPTQFKDVIVSFSTESPTAAPAPAFADVILEDGTNTLVITSAEIVLRDVELKRVEVQDCDVEPEPEGCEEFEAGPVLVALPVDGSVRAAFELPIPTGTYTRIDFEIHKISGSDPEDAAFLAANPDFDNVSIRVIGTFNSQAFEFLTDLNVEQELTLAPALVIDETTTSTNLTIQVGLDGWFRNGAGVLLDPATGNKGGENESVIQENIKVSIEAFEDEDRDGREG